ncbi:glycosyltransferase family 4 protein [Chryseobacterium gotjawalense]|uniref:Glycosyltransferase family 4 protein n=1 Tax=Chryseobacterium gotjawalense TaxID=3042315 RepID=A0ABY8RD72_9FLAO|nr:glycosyltransferase family 4 protein [Chryseobacterium sp. wdc7]WHF51449.1 glycosyltransferase family 4 protein [Chryseobacterium sp. wdc7]
MKKLFRISTIPMSLNLLLKGQLRYLNQFYEVTVISGAGSDLEEVREREGVKVEAIEMSREISILKDLVALFQLYRFFKKEKPDIVHSITPKAGLLTMMAARLAGVPVRMHTFTGLIFPYKKGLLKFILIWMDRLLASSATHVYPEGKGVKEDLERYRISRKPLKILAHGNVNGIDTSYFNPETIAESDQENLRLQLGLSEEDFVFIFVGRLVRDKGINELVTAFKNLNVIARRHDEATPTPHNLKLLLVGPFEQELDPLEAATLKEIETNPHIISVGFQTEVRPYFALSDALVFPSYREGFPNVVLQSLAMELPAIVTDINGCNEIITPGENGLIIPVKNAEVLQAAMEALYTDTSLYQSLKNNTRKSIFLYEQKAVWEALLEEYRLVNGVNV